MSTKLEKLGSTAEASLSPCPITEAGIFEFLPSPLHKAPHLHGTSSADAAAAVAAAACLCVRGRDFIFFFQRAIAGVRARAAGDDFEEHQPEG